MPKPTNSKPSQPAQPPAPTHDLPSVVHAMIVGDSLPGTHPPAALADAADYFAAVAQRTDPAALVGLNLLRMEDQYRRALAADDIKTCLAIASKQIELAETMTKYDFGNEAGSK